LYALQVLRFARQEIQSMDDFSYPGSELDLFSAVLNWKAYWSRQIRPYIHGELLEVGAGIGSNTRFLTSGNLERCLCLEPDQQLSAQLTDRLKNSNLTVPCEIGCGTLDSLGDRLFDSIAYIDVLEHIADDRDELKRAASRLKSGGHLIVLSPAHQRLFSDFDTAIGHFRRYDRSMLLRIAPPELHLKRLFYLDSAGLLLSAVNALALRQSMPTAAQLRFWDRRAIPVSRVLDRCFRYSLGKSIIGIWSL
jgi:hypothetical protein